MSSPVFHPISNAIRRPVYAIKPETRVSEVHALAERLHVHHFPIMVDGEVLGIVCTCDLLEALPDASVSGWARCDVVTLDPTGTTEHAAALMRDQGVGSVVIAEDSRPCGIVTREDLARDPKLALTLEMAWAASYLECPRRWHEFRARASYGLAQPEQARRATFWVNSGSLPQEDLEPRVPQLHSPNFTRWTSCCSIDDLDGLRRATTDCTLAKLTWVTLFFSA